jgi:hypothetical protein
MWCKLRNNKLGLCLIFVLTATYISCCVSTVFHLPDIVVHSGRALDYIQYGGCEWSVLALQPAFMYWMWRNDLPGNDGGSQFVIKNILYYPFQQRSSQPLAQFWKIRYVFLRSYYSNPVLPLKDTFFEEVRKIKFEKITRLCPLGLGINGTKLDKNIFWNWSSRGDS